MDKSRIGCKVNETWTQRRHQEATDLAGNNGTDVREAIALIKSKMNIVDFFKAEGFEMKPSGVTRWLALCPFHHEKTPSFSISETMNRYHCFGCGASGDIFTYLEARKGLSFMEAVESMCDRLGIQLNKDEDSAAKSNHRKVLMDITARTWKFFRDCYDGLPETHVAKEHEIREKRGISSDAADNHNLFGWAPENRTALLRELRSAGFKDDDLVDAGVMRRSEKDGSLYCLWSARLMFPICDVIGRPVGFSGRAVYYKEGEKIDRKYVNSPETEIYHKRELLFCQSIAREQARTDHEVYVVEGQFDVIAMQHSGHDNTVASSGTALSEQQTRSLQRMVGSNGRIVFMFDADAAGQKAARRTFEQLGALQPQAYASVTDGKDPSDMLKEDGPEALNRQAESIKPLWEHVFRNIVSVHDLSTPVGRDEFIADFNEYWSHVSDPIISDSSLRLAALRLGLRIEELRPRLNGNDSNTSSDDDNGIIITPLSDREDFGSDPTSAAVNATCLENLWLRPVLAEVRMKGMDERFRRYMVEHDQLQITPENMDDEQMAEYVRRLGNLTDRMNELSLLAPERMDPNRLFVQQLDVLFKVQLEEAKKNAVLSKMDAGDSKDPTVLKSFDKAVRQAIQDVVDDADERAERIKKKLDELIPDAAEDYTEAVWLNTPDALKSIASQQREKLNDYITNMNHDDRIDVDEPVMSVATPEIGDDDAPYYDPDDEPFVPEEYADC